jgi:hypothetical protein
MTSQDMDMMTQYYYEQDYSNCSDWSVLFSSHKDFCYALNHTNHVMHKHAKTIKVNKDRSLNFNNSFDAGTQRSIDNYYSNMPSWAR